MTLAPDDRRELVFEAVLAELEQSRARERRLQETTKALRGLVLRMLATRRYRRKKKGQDPRGSPGRHVIGEPALAGLA